MVLTEAGREVWAGRKDQLQGVQLISAKPVELVLLTWQPEVFAAVLQDEL